MKKLVLFSLVLVAALGCGNKMSDDGLSSKDQQAASRIDQIAKQSGGDWNNVSQADRDYLVKEVSMGSEQSAKMLLMGKAGKLNAAPGGKK